MKKKFILCLISLLFIFTIVGCGKDKVEPTKDDNKEVIDGDYVLIDKTKEQPDFVCAEALEGFYEDDDYLYYYSCIKSDYIVVRYKDGHEEPVKDALKNGKITIKDLDKYGISYYKELKER